MLKKALSSAIAVSLLNSSAIADGNPYIGSGLNIGVLGNYTHQLGGGINFFGGYGGNVGQYENIYLAGELNVNTIGYSLYGVTYGLGLSFVPGIKLSKYTLLYGRLGANIVYSPKVFNPSWGAQYGIGIQTSLARYWDIRTEYTCSSNRNLGLFGVGFVYKFL